MSTHPSVSAQPTATVVTNAGAANALRDLLRSSTADAHTQLEDTLGLLQPPLQQNRFVLVLAGFHGFHAAWEPAIAACLNDSAFTTPRQRLVPLHGDLLALGLQPADLTALPVCANAAGLCSSLDAALGALYVVEGSTLGGKVIDKQLAQAPWCPSGGLRYFNAHGAQTGSLWRETMAFIDSHVQDPQQVALGAQQAFTVLRHWLAAALPRLNTPAGGGLQEAA